MAAPPLPPQTGAPPNTIRDPHLLALKVLRTARPSLGRSHSVAYYEDGSLAGEAVKGVRSSAARDFNAEEAGVTGALLLPSTFGTIHLGETFSAIVCLSNDLPIPSHGSSNAFSPVLRIELQTSGFQTPAANAPTGDSPVPVVKHHLKTLTVPNGEKGNGTLEPGQSIEGMVQHEIKEMGTHALICTVTYGAQIRSEDSAKGSTTASRSFRKVYKFNVANPLSVRTKAHSPNVYTASSILSAEERGKIFLEVQVQNQCEQAMWFERMKFDPISGWTVEDVNNIVPVADPDIIAGGSNLAHASATGVEKPKLTEVSLFDSNMALLPSAAVRQYLYTLSPSPSPSHSSTPPAPPGSSQALGRLDIVWRTSNGETGRLQTSMLGRRVPIPPLDSLGHTYRQAATDADHIRPQPAGVVQSQSQAAAISQEDHGGSPARNVPAPYRPSRLSSSTSSGTGIAVTTAGNALDNILRNTSHGPPLLPSDHGLFFDLTVLSVSPSQVLLNVPFTISFNLKVTDKSSAGEKRKGNRKIKLVAQHVDWYSNSNRQQDLLGNIDGAGGGSADILESQPRDPNAVVTQANRSLLPSVPQLPPLRIDSVSSFEPNQPDVPPPQQTSIYRHISSTSARDKMNKRSRRVVLPMPVPLADKITSPAGAPSPYITRLGSSLIHLAEMNFAPLPNAHDPSIPSTTSTAFIHEDQSATFEMGFVVATTAPGAIGIQKVGGLRIMLTESNYEGDVDEGGARSGIEGRTEAEHEPDYAETAESGKAAKIVLEFDVVAEVWVRSTADEE